MNVSLNRMFGAAALLLAVGCAGVKAVYTEVPTGGVELVDYEGELKAEQAKDMKEEDLIRARAAEGYRLVGRADFTVSGNQTWTDAMVRKGREIRAGKIDYIADYSVLESAAAGQDALAMQDAAGAGWASNVSDTRPTMAGSSEAAFGLSIDHYVYHVYYFKKLKNPSAASRPVK